MKKEIIIGKKYKLTKKLGKGAFGEIYCAVNIKENKEYAMKLEKTKNKYP